MLCNCVWKWFIWQSLGSQCSLAHTGMSAAVIYFNYTFSQVIKVLYQGGSSLHPPPPLPPPMNTCMCAFRHSHNHSHTHLPLPVWLLSCVSRCFSVFLFPKKVASLLVTEVNTQSLLPPYKLMDCKLSVIEVWICDETDNLQRNIEYCTMNYEWSSKSLFGLLFF